MNARSRLSVPVGFIFSHLTRALREDWRTALSFFRFQMAKETFSLRHPRGAPHGKGDRVHLVGLRITDLCNLRCHSCGQWGDSGYLLDIPHKKLKANEVPVSVYKKMVDDIAAAGWSPIWYIWGGEPMLYPDLFELLYYIRERGMTVSLVTNGTNVAKHADVILDTCNILHLSLDGHNAEIHNKQRPGVSASHDNFQAVFEALEAINAGKRERHQTFPYIVPLSCITSYNFGALRELYEFSSQYADAHIFYLTWWIDLDSARAHGQDFERRFGCQPATHLGWIGSWKEFDHAAIYDKVSELKEIYRQNRTCPPIILPDLKSPEDYVRYYTDHTATFGYEQCVSIYMTLELDSNGDVSLCRDYHDFTLGNIKDQSIIDLWNNEKAMQFRSSISREGIMPACRRCCGLMGF